IVAAPDNETPKHDIRLGVTTFKADPLYNEMRLVYRDSRYEGKYYNYHRWIAAPDRLITDRVIEQFSHSNVFKQVVPFPRFTGVDLLLGGQIKAIEEWDEGDQWQARVKIRFDLIQRDRNELIWQTEVEHILPVATKTPAAVVKGINKCVQLTIDSALEKLDKFLTDSK
ncbi:MAG: ABC-type transport auxiliary lipoprotein family protein, partial [bacterium]|nr:ABC-type transport auxiliary lipoprotein family protein [bacterium]